MRVTFNMMAKSFAAAQQRNQGALLTTQLQLATGRRVMNPSDDPGAAVRIEALKRGLEANSIQQENAEAARRRLSIEEEALDQVTDILQRMRELTITANNSVLDAPSRVGIADEVRQLSSALVQLANSQDGRGEYLFGGYRVSRPPFAVQAETVVYEGDQGRRELQVGETRRIADGDPGDLVFMAVEPGRRGILVTPASGNTGTGVLGQYSLTGVPPADTLTLRFTSSSDYEVLDSGGAVIGSGTYAPGDTVSFAGITAPLSGSPAAGDEFTVAANQRKSMFDIARDLVIALEDGGTDAASEARRQNGFAAALNALDGALASMSEVRTSVGARLKAAEAQRDINEGFALQLETALSSIRDIDYSEALTRLETQLASLEAAQRSFAETRQLSLFDFI